MAPKDEIPAPVAPSRAPRSGVFMMGLILLAMALLALYTNYEKARVQEIEKVTIIEPAAEGLPAPSPSPAAR